MPSMNQQSPSAETTLIKVDVIIAVYNAESTIEETVRSAMHQIVPDHYLIDRLLLMCPSDANDNDARSANSNSNSNSNTTAHFDICVCCYNDASTDKSFNLLESMVDKLKHEHVWNYQSNESSNNKNKTLLSLSMQMKLLIGSAPTGTSSRGAGYARNQAVKLRDNYEQQQQQHCTSQQQQQQQQNNTSNEQHHFLCILDSDDIMHPTRIAEQTCAMLSLLEKKKKKKNNNKDDTVRCGGYEINNILMGCQFDRIPQDSTRHYTQWANSLDDERVYLEQFRECTLVSSSDSRYRMDMFRLLDIDL